MEGHNLVTESASHQGTTESLAADQQVTGDDVIESGNGQVPLLDWLSRQLPVLRWRPGRTAVVLGIIGLVAGLAAGYGIGARHAASPAPPAQASAAPVSVVPLTAGGSPLGFNGSRCSSQVGHELQLGVEVTNNLPGLLTVLGVDAVLPAGGLKVVSWAWGPCGELAGTPPPEQSLTTGSSNWFTVTFQVLVGCPAPLPVQFNFQFDLRSSQDSRAAFATVAAFPDLGQVPYSGCH
jgi:hypothetical protein